MILATLKQSTVYQTYVRRLVWASILASRYCRDFRNELVFRKIAKQEIPLLSEARLKNESLYAHEKAPLVSIITPTYNRGRLLVERTLPSVLCQTYQNFEMVIVGDHCTDDTPDLIAKIKDPRIRFYNLPERPPYPKKGLKRYRSVGTVASNTALDLACGSWIAHMDDDDVLTPDHIETLLTHARSGNYEFVSGRIRLEKRPGEWVEQGGGLILNGGLKGHISHSTVLYRSYLRFLKYDIQAWKLGMAGDTHLWRRMRNAGVRAGFVSQVVAILPLRPGETVRSICQPE